MHYPIGFDPSRRFSHVVNKSFLDANICILASYELIITYRHPVTIAGESVVGSSCEEVPFVVTFESFSFRNPLKQSGLVRNGMFIYKTYIIVWLGGNLYHLVPMDHSGKGQGWGWYLVGTGDEQPCSKGNGRRALRRRERSGNLVVNWCCLLSWSWLPDNK